MPLVAGTTLFRSREEILNDLVTGVQQRIPDAYMGEDGVLFIILSVVAGVVESIFLANDVLKDDQFVQTASEEALDRKGDEYGFPRQAGTTSVGTVLFSGDGGTVIPVGTEVAYDPGAGADYLYFKTTDLATIPNPGAPAAPTVAVNATAGNLNGIYEYVVTFVTAAGETLPGAESLGINPVSQQVNLTAIPLGGPGTTARRIYRQKNGGVYNLVATLADNTTVVFTDNVTDAAVGGNPPALSTAQSVSAPAASEDPGFDYNVGPAAITVLTDAPDGVTTVTNTLPFTGGTDTEATEDFRIRLLDAIRAPETGSAADLESWAEAVTGVDSATVFQNDNMGVATPGHTTIRISGPAGTIPPQSVLDAVSAVLVQRDIANITLHVGTFTSTVTPVTVATTLAAGYTLAGVTASVQAAVAAYINGLPVGATLRISGIISAVFGLPGILDVTVTTPSTNQATGATSKRVAGVITVT